MNPLSAIRLPVGPDMLRAMAPAVSPDIARPVIPQYELGKLAPAAPLQPNAEIAPVGGTFENTLGRMVAEVSGKQAAATDAVTGLLAERGVPLHQAVIAMEEASVSFQLMVEVRNKLLESYQELMRMQV
ncbi:MAG: flagellar hook-basal body complex protein FliE [Verrucomicrobiota bacterium]